MTVTLFLRFRLNSHLSIYAMAKTTAMKKADIRPFLPNAGVVVDCAHDSEDDNGSDNPKCLDCDGPSRLQKNSTGKYNKYCDDCHEANGLLYASLHRIKALKRKVVSTEKSSYGASDVVERLKRRRVELDDEIDRLVKKLQEKDQVNEDYKKAIHDLNNLL